MCFVDKVWVENVKESMYGPCEYQIALSYDVRFNHYLVGNRTVTHAAPGETRIHWHAYQVHNAAPDGLAVATQQFYREVIVSALYGSVLDNPLVDRAGMLAIAGDLMLMGSLLLHPEMALIAGRESLERFDMLRAIHARSLADAA